VHAVVVLLQVPPISPIISGNVTSKSVSGSSEDVPLAPTSPSPQPLLGSQLDQSSVQQIQHIQELQKQLQEKQKQIEQQLQRSNAPAGNEIELSLAHQEILMIMGLNSEGNMHFEQGKDATQLVPNLCYLFKTKEGRRFFLKVGFCLFACLLVHFFLKKNLL
jgi:hypothetical protein